jgi:hypothetical protein
MTRYELLARDVFEAIAAMMEEVPKLDPKERRSKAFIRTHLGIPPKFVGTTVGAIESTAELKQMNLMNLAAAYTTRHLMHAFQPIVWRLANVVEELQLMLDTRQANTVAEALKVYEIAKALLRRREGPGAPGTISGAMVELMKRDLRRHRPRKRKAGAASAAPVQKKRSRNRKPLTVTQRLRRRIER